MSGRSRKQFTLPGIGLLRPCPGAKPRKGAHGRVPGGQALVHEAQPSLKGIWAHLPVSPPTTGGVVGVMYSVSWVVARDVDPG